MPYLGNYIHVLSFWVSPDSPISPPTKIFLHKILISCICGSTNIVHIELLGLFQAIVGETPHFCQFNKHKNGMITNGLSISTTLYWKGLLLLHRILHYALCSTSNICVHAHAVLLYIMSIVGTVVRHGQQNSLIQSVGGLCQAFISRKLLEKQRRFFVRALRMTRHLVKMSASCTPSIRPRKVDWQFIITIPHAILKIPFIIH